MQAPLISVAIATVVFTQLMGQMARDDLYKARIRLGVAQGQQLDRFVQAVNTYASNNTITLTTGAGGIVDAKGAAGSVASMYAPTAAELTTMGYLKANFNATNYFGGGYASNLSLDPLGCSYPNCTVGGLAYLTQPIMSKGLPDLTVLSSATQAVGSAMGFSKQTSPGTINGFSGGWNKPNPAGNVAGILAEQVGSYAYDSLYYRLDGATGLKAAFNAGGQILGNLKIVGAGTACPANSLGISDGSNGVAAGAVLACQGGSWKSTLTLPGTTIYAGGGAESTYGGFTVRGSKNGWSGINFKDAAGADSGTLMMHPSYSGFYLPGDAGWRWYVTNAGDTIQAGVAYTGAVSATGLITAGSISASGNISGDKLQVSGVVASGAGCSPNGLIAQDGTGSLLSCKSGIWTNVGGSSGLGIGQTWQNVARSCGIAYSNTTGKPIMANIYVGNTAAQGFPFFNAYVNGVLVSTFNSRSWGANGGANVGSSVNFIVPNGATYNCAMSGDVAIYSWTELR